MTNADDEKSAWLRTSTGLTVRECPSCHRRLDAMQSATIGRRPTGPREPAPGHATICAYCTAVLIVTEEGFRLATQVEIDALPELMQRLARDWRPVRGRT
jgi:hypothetical protein